ncbi:hypothetical protein CAOG_06955 [Capsaspora owczarzaki ATCC 30864]|uniref:hypothetical protein n=1 Tax=Capsaspora owczarzaki (strain ATCC 30864) TaxID=595528 RepID=UPI0003523D8D|nr:hypothetical protein CAOG_06955 [Capsaspora owczarzaki ATCC 30864]|eukprot:XP_004343679.2 hypothetical protein CAOG_06955 [Capsaspora owczarzaki ATCC 30864]
MSYCYPSGVNLQPPGPHNVTNSDDGCACVETVAAGLSNPLGLVNAQDGSGRLFIIEQKLAARYACPLMKRRFAGLVFANALTFFLDMIVVYEQQGLLSMAFHPQYNVTGRVFIYYSSTEATSANHVAILSEYRVNATNPNAVDPTTERVILRIQQPYANHNGGTLLFDSKGMLLLSLGDGGAGGDPHGNGQNFNSLLGSVVRLNVSDTASPYTIPTDNPFPATSGVRPEIFAKGLRNPFRCSYDRANSSRLICGDVGQAVREEVTYVVSGGNNGWARREGFACYGDCGPVANYVPPILDYPHANGDACVIGGYVYRGCTFPGFQGKYIFGDNISGRFYIAQENATVASGWTFRELCIGSSNVCHGKSKSTHFPILMTFGEDENGELYFGATRDGDVNGATGAVYRLSDPSLRANPATCPDFISPAQLIDEFNSTSSRGNSAATMLHSVSAWSVISSVLFVLVGRVLG